MGLLLGFSVLSLFRRIFLGSGSNQQRRRQNQTGGSSRQGQTQYKAPPRKKIIEKDEGEYVEYEEIK
ncbi:MAG: DUF4834 family protein [Tannerellaceae bacterium]|nr:DUF4834 family protein [Tannerellaceae bacterium]